MKVKNQEITTNHTTGEVTETSKTFTIRVKDAAQFYMTFLDNMSGLLKIKSVTDRNVLDALCGLIGFNSNVVHLPTSVRKEIVTRLNITQQSFSNSIANLKKAGLIHGEGGVYEINPKVFWRGTTDGRNKLLKDQGLEINIKFKIEDSTNPE